MEEEHAMKPDYKNWVPKGMIYGLLAGTGVLTAAFAGSLVVLKNVSTPVRTGAGIVLGLGALGCGKFAQWSIMAYRQFSYDGKRKLSKQIIEGTAEYVNLTEGGKGLDVGCGSGALTIACAKRNPQGSFIGIDRWGKEYASFSKNLCENKQEILTNSMICEGHTYDNSIAGQFLYNLPGYNDEENNYSYEIEMCLYWWARRNADDTMDLFYQGLKTVYDAYYPAE